MALNHLLLVASDLISRHSLVDFTYRPSSTYSVKRVPAQRQISFAVPLSEHPSATSPWCNAPANHFRFPKGRKKLLEGILGSNWGERGRFKI